MRMRISEKRNISNALGLPGNKRVASSTLFASGREQTIRRSPLTSPVSAPTLQGPCKSVLALFSSGPIA